MASTEKYRDKSGKELFAARWRQDGKQVKKRGFTSEPKAQKYANQMEVDAERGMLAKRSDYTVIGYARYWATTRAHRPTTQRRIEKQFTNYLEPTRLGKRKLADAVHSEVQGWVNGLTKQGLAASTVRTHFSTLRAVFNQARKDGLIVGPSPVEGIDLPNKRDVDFVRLTSAQIEALADAMPDRCRAAIIAQAGLGLRIGELTALRVDDVKWLRGEVEARWQFTDQPEKDERGWPKRTPLKARDEGHARTIPLPEHVREALAAHLVQFPAAEDGSIFTSVRGKPYSNVRLSHLFGEAVEKAGLPDNTTSHDLRHTYASDLLDMQFSTVAVAELLGHKDASLVERVYGHAPTDVTAKAKAALDAAWGKRNAV